MTQHALSPASHLVVMLRVTPCSEESRLDPVLRHLCLSFRWKRLCDTVYQWVVVGQGEAQRAAPLLAPPIARRTGWSEKFPAKPTVVKMLAGLSISWYTL